MKIIYKPRNAGKTTDLIKLSAKTGSYIICADRKRVENVMDLARKLDVSIPFPITFEEILNRQYHAKGIKGVLIDDTEDFIKRVCFDLDIQAITLNQHDSI